MSRLQHKRGKKSNYVHALNTPYWRDVRKKIIVRDRSCRRVINGSFCGSKLFLEVHHTTYNVDGINIIGKELEYLYTLILYCSKCHKIIDNR